MRQPSPVQATLLYARKGRVIMQGGVILCPAVTSLACRLCCRVFAALGTSLVQLNSWLPNASSPTVLLSYTADVGSTVCAATVLADLTDMPPAAAACFASQCTPFLLRCGTAALQALLPQDVKLSCAATLLIAL